MAHKTESKSEKAFRKVYILSMSKHFKGANLLKFKACSTVKVKVTRLLLNTYLKVCSDQCGFV